MVITASRAWFADPSISFSSFPRTSSALGACHLQTNNTPVSRKRPEPPALVTTIEVEAEIRPDEEDLRTRGSGMDPRRQCLDGSGDFWDVGFDPTRPSDADIDPLLGLVASSDDMITPPIWDTTLDQQVGLFDATFADASVHEVLPTAISASSHYTRSQSGTVPSESAVGGASQASRASSQSSVPSVHFPSPSKSKKPSRRKQQRQQQQQQPQQQAHYTRRRAQEPLQASKVKEESEEEAQSDGDDETKRNDFLQRNRLAASKCRQKKKEWVNNLEATKSGLEHQNVNLQMEYNGLVDEVSRMKHQLMAHATCNDDNIDRWIENEARRVVENSAQRRNSMRLPTAGPRNHVQHRKSSRRPSRSDLAESPTAEMNYDYMPDGMFQSRA
ncbi:hypothetical protein G7Z17_g9929 [Cylindrodendrum hubeiense]|uniref:BZIP domain-containing protein n=1 Tax=Cylindrodendrum hubeiense TaxID=595255 RepID=A0A9P5GYK6_9HYPO|nr:hypothetical protein G7Z17_g9929 [Cylindrodendrum hubeiense]